jgi:hypothetical protein
MTTLGITSVGAEGEVQTAYIGLGRGDFIVYRLPTGEIWKQISGWLNPPDWDPTISNYIVLGIPLTMGQLTSHKVDLDTLTVVPKTVITYTTSGTAVADSVTEYIIGDLPEGTTYEREVLDDNSLELTFDEPGEVVVSLTNPLYLALELTIDVAST